MIYTFGDCQINETAYELWRSKNRVNVEPQVLDLLLLLIKNRDRIVTKDEIIDKIWQGRAISDSAISVRLKTARQLIGDTGKKQNFIRTIHGRGFRFIASVDTTSLANQENAQTSLKIDAMSPKPTTQYAKSGEVHIAYHLFGEGPIDLVLAPGFISQIENYWDDPHLNNWLTALGKNARVAMFDKRGTGLSDQVPNLPGMDERMDDVRAVMDAVGFDQAVIMGVSEGGSLATLFAASNPERVTGLIVYGAFSQFTSWFSNDAALQELFDYAQTDWGTGKSVWRYAPSMAEDEAFKRWWGKFERLGATPGAVIDLMRMNQEIDISGTLSSIKLPTLVIHRAEDTLIDVEGGLSLANGIPGAKYVEFPGKDHLPWVGENSEQIIEAISDFLASLPEAGISERFLATVLVLKMEGAESEPGSGENLLGELESSVQKIVIHNGGNLIDQNRNTLTARFNGPARALRSAAEIVDMVNQSGQTACVGIHTGEVDLSEAKAGGMAAEIAASVANLADDGEVIVSRTVKDLIAGSGIKFEYAGMNQLANISESWQLYRVIN